MKDDEIKKVVTGQKGKKAMIKKLDKIPEDTKPKKLPRPVMKALEEEFGVKLAKVRVHASKDSTAACKQLKAKAFTHGPNIYVFKPADVKNNKLLAHELTHVLQQNPGNLRKSKPGKVLVAKGKAKG